jgi:hypothetical protein
VLDVPSLYCAASSHRNVIAKHVRTLQKSVFWLQSVGTSSTSFCKSRQKYRCVQCVMRCCSAVKRILANVSKDHGAFIFMGQAVQKELTSCTAWPWRRRHYDVSKRRERMVKQQKIGFVVCWTLKLCSSFICSFLCTVFYYFLFLLAFSFPFFLLYHP